MAVQLDQNGKDDLKTQFVTREGTYRLMTLSEYSRPNRVGYTNNQSSPQVRVSIVSLPSHTAPQQTASPPLQAATQPAASIGTTNGQDASGYALATTGGDRICYNFGKELFVYAYRGVKKQTADLSKPIDKKLYKGTNPSCHDFNSTNATSEGAPLLVGFTTGQIQLVQPGRREPGKLYNEERLIDKTKVTCLKWLPSSPNLFLAAHASGHLYLYNEELPCTPTAPNYQQFKMGEGFVIYTCKSKSTRNPLYKWSFGTDNGSINEFSFSPCGSNLAIVSQDGFLRVFHYDTMELLGIARSYFGGFLCVCWSPDGKYIVVGGEDDLVTVWSMQERRVVARGQGHRSWVSVVAFDPYTTSYSHWDGPDFSDDENPINDGGFRNFNTTDGHDSETQSGRRPPSSARDSAAADKMATSYRLGSVSQDTQLCLWDITEDVLRQPVGIRHRLSSHDPQQNLVNGEVEHKGASSSASGSSVSSASAALTISSGASRDNVDNSRSSSGKGGVGGTVPAGRNANSLANDSAPVATNSDSSKHWNSVSAKSAKGANVIGNCVGNSVASKATDSPDAKNGSSGKSSDGISAFNTLTQRLSHLGFGSDKAKEHGGSHHHSKKTFSLSKSSGNHHFLHNNNSTSSPGDTTSNATKRTATTVAANGNGTTDGDASSGNSNVGSYDPMKLIGTSACPRFDECPVLEPLVCKKIAHERLTALIFREDCFLTACQDGIIYTWARPGFSNAPQHASSSPTAPPGGTVV
ncbi:WD repeat-containing protein 20 [Lutzomyia longipalpis]|uniref:WD repeat-containing protein 20 n=1 Tax=Lutzomyia longipalpis TaxID=7200 RepID=UPI0024841491|nr:WD repeat-containing protein 20 [Lutzomyia longipalpis]